MGDAVAPAYIVERVLLMLCDEMTKHGTGAAKIIQCAGRFPGLAMGGTGTLILTAAQGVLDPLSR